MTLAILRLSGAETSVKKKLGYFFVSRQHLTKFEVRRKAVTFSQNGQV